MSKITANSNKVVIKRPEAATQSPGGIVLPESSQHKVCSGVVISVTSNYNDEEFDMPDFFLKSGDMVVFKEYSGTELEIDNETYVVVDLNDILVKIGE